MAVIYGWNVRDTCITEWMLLNDVWWTSLDVVWWTSLDVVW